MAKRIKEYLTYIDAMLKDGKADFSKEIPLHLQQIAFFMHERLVHLIVMVLFAVLAVGTLITFIVSEVFGLLILGLAMMVLLVPYISHYYLLENSVQKMYDQYDEMLRLSGVDAFAVEK